MSMMHEKRIASLEKRVEVLEKTISVMDTSQNKLDKNFEQTLIEKIDNIPIPHLAIISLRIHSEQTKKEIEETLHDWGKNYRSWFSGGNFNNRLIKTLIIKQSEQKNKVFTYTLTKKGKIKAEKIINKYTSSSQSEAASYSDAQKFVCN